MKNKKKRVIPIYSDMRHFLRLAFDRRDAAWPSMFQKDGGGSAAGAQRSRTRARG